MGRPDYTEESFLRHLFSPSKNAKPVGLRRSTLSARSWRSTGRSSRRVATYNKMSAVNQAALREAGARDMYLKGDISLAEVKRGLRRRAVDMQWARPTKAVPAREPRPAERPLTRKEMIERQVARHLKRTLASVPRPFNALKIDERVPTIPDEVIGYVPEWDYPQIKEAASVGSPFEIIEDGVRYNPFWYN